MYLEKKKIIENKKISLEGITNDELCNESHISSLIRSFIDDNSYDSIPDILHQNNISKGKTKNVIIGKWNQDGFDILNILLDKVEEKRKSTSRKMFEQEFQ